MEYTGQFTITDSRLVKGKDGRWTSTIKYTQGRSKDLNEWEEKSTTSTAFSDQASMALAEATFTMMEYLKTLDYSLFESGNDVKDNS